MEKLAVIDLGSNSIRMSIFAIEGKAITALETFRSTIGLSRGMSEDMCLRKESQSRAVEKILEYKSVLCERRIESLCFVATAAVRKAKNQREFLERVKRETGLAIKVITGEQEAALDALAVGRNMDIARGIICDIGGGSTELIEVGGTNKISIPVGCRGICEMFFEKDEKAQSIEMAENFIKDKLQAVQWLKDMKALPVAGIGGTLRAFARHKMGEKATQAVDNYRISTGEMRKIIEDIIAAEPDAREAMPGIGKERADIILGGALFVKCLDQVLEPLEYIVGDIGVREGVAIDYAENMGIL